MSKRDELARESWGHLQHCRRLVRSSLPGVLVVPFDDVTGGAVDDIALRARTDGADRSLPTRLVDGNLGAALAGEMQRRLRDDRTLDIHRVTASMFERAGGVVASTVDLRTLEHRGVRLPYYHRRTCCLRDRVTDRHRCDTCSLRDDADLPAMVRAGIDRRLDDPERGLHP
ncbi:MAG: hypothetical protein AAF081_13990 [Actinomycetota bacterium]